MAVQNNVPRAILFSFVALVFCFCGIFIFTLGFIPIKVFENATSSLENLPAEPCVSENQCYNIRNHVNIYKRRYSRFVLIIIDALRSDFVFHTHSQRLFFNLTPFKYIEELKINRKAIYFSVNTYSPTVTLPRIKSLVTGGLSSFVDIIVNFNALQLNGDSIIHQIHARNDKIIFYGDDTWIKLFPKQFYRAEGTHSFFVSDYKEVDDNVTRHLNHELLKDDWKLMILHYLGVDHIGHSKGPYSPLMYIKLEEMDEIIKNIYLKLKFYNDTLPNLIVLCGDHGMTNSGSHGGNTYNEIMIPFVLLSTDQWKTVAYKFPKSISQLDIAPTLSVLLGLPIPANSIGIVIPEMLMACGMPQRDIMYTMYYNLLHLLNILKHNSKSTYIDSTLIEDTIIQHKKWLQFSLDNKHNATLYFGLLQTYHNLLLKVQKVLLENVTAYNDILMYIGTLFILVSILLQFCNFVYFESNNWFSFYFYQNISLINWLFIGSFSILLTYVYFQNFVYTVFFIILIICLILCSIELKRVIHLNKMFIYLRQPWFILLLIPIVSLTSSSYIEEEHQVWYFLSQTIFGICCFENLLFYLLENLYKQGPNYKSSFFSLFQLFVLQNNEKQHKLVNYLLLLFIHRLLRSWNQTGNKWINCPDISDWLLEKPFILHIIGIFSNVFIFFYLKNILNTLPCLLLFINISCIYVYHFHKDTLLILSDHYNVICPRIIYLIVVILIALSIKVRFTEVSSGQSISSKYTKFLAYVITGWVTLTLTITRTQNIPVFAGILLQEHLLSMLLWKSASCSSSLSMISYFIMAMCSFFYQGNSNSVSTIDVFAGYTGLLSYHPIFIGFLMICNTYNGPVFWILATFYRICNIYQDHRVTYDMQEDNRRWLIFGYLVLTLYRLITLCIYIFILYFQRFHLFVWSVFAPKYLYEIAHTLIFTVLPFIILSLIVN